MLRRRWIFLPLLMLIGAAHGQTILQKSAARGDIIESTDPAKVAEVERKAMEIIAAQEKRQSQTMGESGTRGTGAKSGSEDAKPHRGQSNKK